jgi:hypothetical protein
MLTSNLLGIIGLFLFSIVVGGVSFLLIVRELQHRKLERSIKDRIQYR